MGSGNTSFDAGVIAAVGAILGIAYVLGAMLALLSSGGNGVLLLADSVSVTTTVGVMLMLTGGFLATGHRYGRYVGILTFGSVAVFGRPSVATPDALSVIQAGFALLLVVYLLFRNPVTATERSNVDESTSATRIGSTLR